MEGFISGRLQVKLDALSPDSTADSLERIELQKKYEKSAWLAKAASRGLRLQIATHTLKGIHPDAKGTSLNLVAPFCTEGHLIGTHSLNGAVKDDVVGNAADLDVFKFLQLEHNGCSLLTRFVQQDPALLRALSEDPIQALGWAQAFASILEGKGDAASHTFAKQIYFPVDDGTYHLLAPLFPTTLVHVLHLRLQEGRFSEASKAARLASRQNHDHPHGYCNHLNMVVRSMGGSKPQNISQLNSERGGANHLLASVPPVWENQGIKLPLQVGSVFDKRGAIGRDRKLYKISRVLSSFLQKVADASSNIHIRNKRAQLVESIVFRVLDLATELQCNDGGWSAQPECNLSWSQKQWLDPDAVESAQLAHLAQAALQGPEASVAPHNPIEATEWREQVAEDFANWLNSQISSEKAPMFDDESPALEWKHTFLKALP